MRVRACANVQGARCCPLVLLVLRLLLTVDRCWLAVVGAALMVLPLVVVVVVAVVGAFVFLTCCR